MLSRKGPTQLMIEEERGVPERSSHVSAEGRGVSIRVCEHLPFRKESAVSQPFMGLLDLGALLRFVTAVEEGV